LISGSCSASSASAPWSAALPSGARGTTTVSSVGGANWCRAVGFAAPIASPIRMSAEAPELSDLPG
jgi:hypothetical protein